MQVRGTVAAAKGRQLLPYKLLGDAAFVYQAGSIHGIDGGSINAADVIHQSDIHAQQLVGAVVDAGAEG